MTALLVLAAVAAAGGAAGLGGRRSPAAPVAAPVARTQVVRCTLTDSASVPGTVGFGAGSPLNLPATGTVTWLPAAGTVVRQGEQLIRVDDRPVVLLYGTVPQYRELSLPVSAGPATSAPTAASGSGRPHPTGTVAPSTTTGPSPAMPPSGSPAPEPGPHGADVAQLETALRALGYSGFTVDDRFTAGTAAAVTRWQRDLGEDPTGTVRLGDVHYAPGPLRVQAAAQARLGQQGADAALVSTSLTALVSATVAASTAWATKGTRVTVTRADGGAASGVIASVGPGGGRDDTGTGDSGDQSADPGGGPSERIVVRVADQTALTLSGSTAVTVTRVLQRRADVLCVPVLALVALAEGGYGLQRADTAQPGYIAVRTGLFAGDKVEVSGAGVRAGLPVQMPADD